MEKSFRSFTIKADGRFLKQDVQAWYSLDYTNYGNPGNPDWIVDFKDDKSQYDFNSDKIQNAYNKGKQYVFDFYCIYITIAKRILLFALFQEQNLINLHTSKILLERCKLI